MAYFVGRPLGNMGALLDRISEGSIVGIISDLTTESSDTVNRPDGVGLCGRHLRIYCNSCGMDHSYTIPGYDSDEPSEDEEEKDDLEDVPEFDSSSDGESEKSIPAEKCLPKTERFIPREPGSIPRELFDHDSGVLFARFSRPRHFLAYTSGACVNEGTPDAKAGCAFIARPNSAGPNFHDRFSKFRVESQGQTGVEHEQTLNRAHLRAVDAVLECRSWEVEGAKRLYIATDSHYVVTGITGEIGLWVENGWLDREGSPVENRDLWELILYNIRTQDMLGVRLFFWLIPSQLNVEAIHEATAATHLPEEKEYIHIVHRLLPM